MDSSQVQFHEQQIVYQDENFTYEEAYTLNGTQIISSDNLISTVAQILGEIISETDRYQSSSTSSFNGRSVPQISIHDYLLRIHRCAYCSQECIIMALIYIDRITERNQNFVLNSFNVHRLLLTGIMLAAKYFDDRYYSNEHYSKVGGINNSELNLLEREFLQYINFNLYISPVLFYRYRQRLLFTNQESNQMQIELSQQQLQNMSRDPRQ